MNDPKRNAQLAAAHAMKRELALSDDCWQGLCLRFSGSRTDSSGAMTAPERGALLDHLRGLGAGRKKSAAGTPAARRRFAAAPQRAKAWALWGELAALNAVSDGSETAFEAFVERQTRVAIGRLDGRQWNRVIEGLKGWLGRKRGQQPWRRP